jgi:copper chaperone NosL
MNKKRIAAAVLLVALAGCAKNVAQVAAQEPGKDTPCSLDGMLLKDFPGPKAQIQYAEGRPDFFCDLVELFAVTLDPEQKRAVAGMFVSDMGKTNWEHPEGHWIDARSALYVVGSKKHGSMGPTFGSFALMADAEAFVRKEGGSILRFEEVTPEVVNRVSMVTHDDKLH